MTEDGLPATSSQAAIDAAYTEWVREHDRFGPAERAAVLAGVARLVEPPTIAVLLAPGFSTAGRFDETLRSLRGQLYPHWDLCLAGPPPPGIGAMFKADPRVRLLGGGPYPDEAAAANAALADVESPYVVLLTEGDQLAPSALYDIAAVLTEHPDTELLYTDEDLIDAAGVRSSPRLKTGWDPDLLLSHDYIGGLAVYRARSVAAVGGWRAGFGGATGYDLALRATGLMLPDRIRHLPAILRHRPAAAARGTLRDRTLGPDALAARKAVQDLLGPDIAVLPAPLLPSSNRVVWPLPERAPMVSVIMPTRDLPWLLGPAAWGVVTRTDYPAFELLIVDNDSHEEATAVALRDLAAHPRVRVLRHPGPFNFSAIANAAVREAAGDIVVLLNNDVDVISPGWMRELASQAMRPDVGAVGARLLYPDGRLQHGGVVLGPGLNATHVLRLSERNDPGYGGELAVTRSFSVVTAACLAIRKSVFLEVGGLDETNLAVAFNDVDLCLRLGEYGYRVICTPFAELFHLESQTRGQPDTPEKLERELREVNYLWRAWRHAFDIDPFHNPNLACAWNEPLHLCPPRRPQPWRRAV